MRRHNCYRFLQYSQHFRGTALCCISFSFIFDVKPAATITVSINKQLLSHIQVSDEHAELYKQGSTKMLFLLFNTLVVKKNLGGWECL